MGPLFLASSSGFRGAPLGALLCSVLEPAWSSLGATLGPPFEDFSENSLDVLGCPLALSWAPLGVLLGSSQGGSSLGSLSSGTPRTLSVFCLIVHCIALYSTGLLSVACAIALFRDPHCTYEHCFALICIALHCLAFVWLTFACNPSSRIALASGFHGNALHCAAILATPFLSLACIAST